MPSDSYNDDYSPDIGLWSNNKKRAQPATKQWDLVGWGLIRKELEDPQLDLSLSECMGCFQAIEKNAAKIFTASVEPVDRHSPLELVISLESWTNGTHANTANAARATT